MFINNKKLKMVAYEFRNALDSYILIMFPFFFFFNQGRKEKNRKGGKEAERGWREGEMTDL